MVALVGSAQLGFGRVNVVSDVVVVGLEMEIRTATGTEIVGAGIGIGVAVAVAVAAEVAAAVGFWFVGLRGFRFSDEKIVEIGVATPEGLAAFFVDERHVTGGQWEVRRRG
jgi:hypothetical protein